MNILYTSYYSEGYGGAEISLALAASEIKKLGHNVFIASNESYSSYGLNTLTFKKYAKIPIFRFHEEYLSKFLAEIIKEKNIDVVHANDRLTAVAAVLAAKRCGVPILVHVRDYWFACPKSTMLRRDLKQCDGCGLKELYNCSTPKRFLWDAYKAIYLKRARKILKTADVAIAASSAVLEKLLRFGFENATIVQNPISQMIAKTQTDYKKKFGLKNTVVTFIGTLDYNKGITELLDVAEQIINQKNTCLFIIGSGPLEKELRATVKEKGIENNVVFTGSVPHSEMANVYAASDIVAVPSLWAEPFGRVAAEAMCAGKPVLASDIGGLKDIVSEEFRIPVFDKDMWHNKLNALIGSKNALIQIGKRNKKQAEQYAPGRIAGQLVKIYREAIDAKSK